MGIFDYRYLSDEQVKGFDHYKYSSVDTSPLAVYISHPFWNWVVQFYPEWLAPNVLTLGGFCLVMGCFTLVSVLDYPILANAVDQVNGTLPDWLWLLCAVCTLVAHIMDGTDGKQARRTGASGPTGELFDHGLDSWATVPFSVTIFSIFGRDSFSISALRLLFILISVQIVFIVTHWEKYNTGILFLSWGYDLSQYGLSIFYLLTWLVGYQFWKFYVFSGLTFAVAFEFGCYASCIGSLAMSLYNIDKAYRVDGTGLQPNVYEAVLPLLPSCLLFGASVFWGAASPTKVNDVDPRLFMWTMGVIFSNIACRLIVAQMTKTRSDAFNPLLLPYLAVLALSVGGLLGQHEMLALRILAAFLTTAHLHYGICVVRQLCDHFGIYAFSLDYLKKRREMVPATESVSALGADHNEKPLLFHI